MELRGNEKRRWTCIDILKCLAAIAVVEIHKPSGNTGGDEFLILCRFAVPVFFMITGFFTRKQWRRHGRLKQFGKIFTITIGANLFYLLWEILLAVEKRENIKEALLARFEKRVPEDFIFVEFFPRFHRTCGVCRQSFSMLLVIAFIVEHLGLRKLAYLAIPVLLAWKSRKGKLFPCFLWEKKTVIFIVQEGLLYCGSPLFLAGL
ncbi:MAG: acyltransferase family protein, partial [Ruminococcus sp.]